MPLTKQLVYIGDFLEEANKLRGNYGKTELYSTGQSVVDDYLGGGYGREDGYEVVLLFGPTGVGKSTVALNFIARPIIENVKVGLLVLEDDMADVSIRLSQILNEEQYERMNIEQNVRCLPQDALVRSWSLADLLEYIESWFEDGVELILLDHLQFAFEGATAIKGENEYIAQRIFMQQLNQLMKRVKKTIILVSHINKAHGAKGMNQIVGSGAIAQASTKVIEIAEDDMDDVLQLNLRKSRFTKKPGFEYLMKMVDSKLERL